MKRAEGRKVKKSEDERITRKNNIKHFRDLEVYRRAFDKLDDEYEQIIAMLNSVERNAKKFCF